MKKIWFIAGLCLLGALPTQAEQSAVAPPVAQVPEAPSAAVRSAAAELNNLLIRIRDGLIVKKAAQAELARVLPAVREEFYRQGGFDSDERDWVFPLAGYDSRAITGGRSKGYIARGYDFFRGNRHGGHPSFDIFIRDRNQDCRDDRSGNPVQVRAMTGGIVVGLEHEWERDSRLRGGKYIWIFDPSRDLLVYYAHNDVVHVEVGQVVKPGDLLGLVGRTGFNAAKHRSPTHLHLTVLKVRNGVPSPVNVYRQLTKIRSVLAAVSPVPLSQIHQN